MNKINHLSKLLKLHERKEHNLILKAIACKKYLDEEMRKLTLLQSCMEEYKAKLKANDKPISAFTYHQYYAFFNQLEKAIFQQNDSVEKSKEVHKRWLNEIEVAKKKKEGIIKLINKERMFQQAKMDKRENQQATEIFNQLKYNK